MNKGTSVLAITIACLLFILAYGYYIESDSAKIYYINPFVSNRAILPPVVNNGITGVEYLEVDHVDVIRGLGQSQNVEKYYRNYTVQLDEADIIKTLVHGVPGDEDHIGSGQESQTVSPSQTSKGSIKKPVDDHVTSNKVQKEQVKEYLVINNKYRRPGTVQNDHQAIQRQLGELYDKRQDIPPKVLLAQASNMQSRLTMTSRLKTQGPRNWRNLPMELYQQAPVIFDTVPRNFLPQFKNPCWYTTNKQLLCLPYFYIIGFPKAGTTDLWDKINNHPQVSRTRKKETQFWRDHQIGRASAFLSYMSNALFLNHRLLSGETQVVYGDGSATTVISHARFIKYFPNVTAGMYTNVDIIKEITPTAKMIIAIREPAERLFSGYLYHPMKQRRSVQGFHQEVLDYLAAFRRCQTKYSELRCIFEKNPEDGRAQRLKTGIYEPYIRSWVDGFGFDQVMIVRLEDWKTGCMEILPQLYEFLELDPLHWENIQKLCKSKAQNTNSKAYNDVGKMLAETKQLLKEFYTPYNKELAKYLNIPIYHVKL